MSLDDIIRTPGRSDNDDDLEFDYVPEKTLYEVTHLFKNKKKEALTIAL